MLPFLLVPFFVLSVAIGILLQWYRLPGRLLRHSVSVAASYRRRVTRSRSGLVALRVRDSRHVYDYDVKRSHTEKDGQYICQTLEFETSELALILIDVWADHPNKGFAARADENIRTKLLPLVQAARAHGILVVHCPHGHPTNPLVKPLPTEPVFNGPGEKMRLVKTLQQRGTKYLLYAGYTSNICILVRPTGIIEMSREGYEIVFARDASLAIEAPEFLDKELTHQVATYMVETNWGVTTNVDEILAALERR